MVVITHYREKCIGCNYCEEIVPERWIMAKSDGKATLRSAKNKKGFYTVKVGDEEFEDNLKAAELCPVKIIQVKKI